MRLLQRGARTLVSTEVEKTTKSKLDLGRAVLSGGLVWTKKVTQSVAHTNHAKEPFLLVQREGGADLMIYEHRMSYQCLGASMAHATLANFCFAHRALSRVVPAGTS